MATAGVRGLGIMALVLPMLASCAGAQPAPVSPGPSPAGGDAGSTAASNSPALPAAPSFKAHTTFVPLGHSLLQPAVGDFNEDGNADVVTTTYTPGQGVLVLLGQGDGTLVQAPDTGVARANVVRAADLNDDGHEDLVAANDKVIVLLGRGDGSFGEPMLIDIGIGDAAPDVEAELWIAWLAVADLDGDGVLDAVAADYVQSELAILVGLGDGTFAAATFLKCPRCSTVAAADLDRDGDPDLISTGFQPSSGFASLSVYRNLGGATFEERRSVEQPCPVAIATGDLNADGAVDLVTGNDACNSSSILIGNGDGTFAAAHSYPADNCHSVAVVDLDDDGSLDVLTGSYDRNKIWFWHGDGDGTFSETEGIDATPNVGTGIEVADFNNDGAIDLVLTASGIKGVVAILLAT